MFSYVTHSQSSDVLGIVMLKSNLAVIWKWWHFLKTYSRLIWISSKTAYLHLSFLLSCLSAEALHTFTYLSFGGIPPINASYFHAKINLSTSVGVYRMKVQLSFCIISCKSHSVFSPLVSVFLVVSPIYIGCLKSYARSCISQRKIIISFWDFSEFLNRLYFLTYSKDL